MLPEIRNRVEQNTSDELNTRLQQDIAANVQKVTQNEITPDQMRIGELAKEWDIERVLQLNASSIMLGSLALGAIFDRRINGFPIVIAGFFLQHALQGWCPPVPIFRRLGVRTAREIEQERQALKVMRGDYQGASMNTPAEQLLQMAKRAV